MRRLEKLDLWEISIVTFPMQAGARVSGVKRLPPASGGRVDSAEDRAGRGVSRTHTPLSRVAPLPTLSLQGRGESNLAALIRRAARRMLS